MTGHGADGARPDDLPVIRLDRHTRLCMSLSGRPSDVGTRFHNYLYAQLGLNFVYKAFTTDDPAGAVAGIRALGIRGCGVSMPFKQQVIELLDTLDPSAEAIGAVNTIVNDEGRLTGHNTDVIAVESMLPAPSDVHGGSALVAGSGGMASAVLAALLRRGYTDVTVAARNPRTGPALAERFGYQWSAEAGGARPGLLINATPLGMAGGPGAEAEPFDADVVAAADTVFEVVAAPAETPLIRHAKRLGRDTMTGDVVMALQAAEQFARYTGVRPSENLVQRAQRYSRLA